MADDLARQIEVPRHAFEDPPLLVVLATKDRDGFADQREQLADHGGHTPEVLWPMRSLQYVPERTGHHMSLEPGRIHRAVVGREHQVHPSLCAERDVGIEGAWVAIEVFGGAELKWVHEHGHHPEGRAPRGGVVDQRQMAGVQRAHRGHHADPGAGRARRAACDAQLRRVANDPHRAAHSAGP